MIAGLLTALAVAFLLGLRHATDPDHLTAVSTLVLGNRRGGLRRAGRGLSVRARVDGSGSG